ncbi:hypothetical protein E4V51_32725 [Paenibacillus sp. 28ISP30-2]|nr:hypothetical protein [Paenibacillus sp. 28ISP30-2]
MTCTQTCALPIDVFGMKNAEYTYDSVSRLTKVSGEGKEVGYSYNGDGLLYERTEGGKTTRYYYNEEAKLMAEAEVEGETPKITYVRSEGNRFELRPRCGSSIASSALKKKKQKNPPYS